MANYYRSSTFAERIDVIRTSAVSYPRRRYNNAQDQACTTRVIDKAIP
ncbi:MAG: hypothetical protein VX112_01760 [Pseudomonadota bacterium]|nr:hypothetical protein [Pseudomonadota bacterium]